VADYGVIRADYRRDSRRSRSIRLRFPAHAVYNQSKKGRRRMPDGPPDEASAPAPDTAMLSAALRGVRAYRRMSARAVAEAMNLPPRTYHRFEAGETRPNLDYIHRFARATQSDAHAILTAVAIGDPSFAWRSADHQLSTVIAVALQAFNAAHGDRIASLDRHSIITAVTGLFDALTDSLDQATLAEDWLQAGAQALKAARPKPGR
jgi:transcriptional regulator with XRE-family HTH domain